MLCHFCQWITARRLDDGDGAELPRWVSEHLGRCSDCRLNYERHRRIAERLSGAACDDRREPPQFLRSRILAHLGPSPLPAVPASRHISPGWTFAVASVTALVLFIALPPLLENDHPGTPGDFDPATLAGLSGLQARETVLRLGSNLDEPLASELRLVMADARTAFAGLSKNFLPSALADSDR